MTDKLFATAINCIDGRVQVPVIEYLQQQYNVDFVDMITEPGPERLLAESTDQDIMESIKRRLKISVNRHDSSLFAVVGHHDCAGNPMDQETKVRQIRQSVKRIESWNLGSRVIGLFVNEKCQIEHVI